MNARLKQSVILTFPDGHINLDIFFFFFLQTEDLEVELKAEFRISNPQKCYGLGIFNLGKLFKRSE